MQFETLSDGTCRLILDKVNVGDQGNYKCEATNSAGTLSSKAPLTIERKFFLFKKMI